MPDAIWPRGIKALAADEDSHIVYARKDFPLHEMYDTDLSGLSAVQCHGRKRHVVLVHIDALAHTMGDRIHQLAFHRVTMYSVRMRKLPFHCQPDNGVRI